MLPHSWLPVRGGQRQAAWQMHGRGPRRALTTARARPSPATGMVLKMPVATPACSFDMTPTNGTRRLYRRSGPVLGRMAIQPTAGIQDKGVRGFHRHLVVHH
jgi:hypothetical protein